MKKILAILAMAVSGSVFAATATVEYQNQSGVDGTANSDLYQLSVREDINKNFAGDVVLNTTAKDSTGGVSSSRAEAGLTGKTTFGIFSPYMRVATGQKFTSTTNFTYYSVEPGVTAPLGNTGVTARVGYRFRDAYDSSNLDTTRTWRAGLAYAITPKDTVGVRYDRVRGDTNQNNWAFNYTRGF
jgi:hypothetical protein